MNYSLQPHNCPIDPQHQVIRVEVTEQELHSLESESNPKERAPDVIAGQTNRLI